MTSVKIISITSSKDFLYGLGEDNKLYTYLDNEWHPTENISIAPE